MLWQNLDTSFEEETKDENSANNLFSIANPTDDKDALQLKKYKPPPSELSSRKAYIDLVTRFGELLVADKLQEIIRSILAEDCQFFLFGSKGVGHLEYYECSKNFVNLYTDRKIQERIIRETYVDLEKSTACQISFCKVLEKGEVSNEISFEIFTIKEFKVVKYRAAFALFTATERIEDLLDISKKEKMLTKIKELNFALAGKPDFEKAASLLHENTEYKIWSWDMEKCLVLTKKDLVKGFENLQDKSFITSIIPYEIYSDSKGIIGTYAYHLEDKEGNRFIWLSTAVYSFDKDINFWKISHLGDLYLEEQVTVPFEGLSREMLENRIHDINESLKPGLDLWYNDFVRSDCDMHRFIPPTNPFVGWQRAEGVQDVDIPSETVIVNKLHIEMSKPVDIFIDQYDPTYETAIVLICRQGMFDDKNYVFYGKRMNSVAFVKMSFENGKLSKLVEIICEISEPIPTPFDDRTFRAANLIN